MPFGLTNAPGTFQRLMNNIFHDVLDEFVVVYLDDILVYSNSEAEHESHLRFVFQRLVDNKLFAKRKKCEFGKSSLLYLGHVVGNGVLQVDSSKVEAVKTWSAPEDTR